MGGLIVHQEIWRIYDHGRAVKAVPGLKRTPNTLKNTQTTQSKTHTRHSHTHTQRTQKRTHNTLKHTEKKNLV
jgi:hypothetical protein